MAPSPAKQVAAVAVTDSTTEAEQSSSADRQRPSLLLLTRASDSRLATHDHRLSPSAPSSQEISLHESRGTVCLIRRLLERV